MSMARVVITAVVVEGRSKSEVARDYGLSRRWVQKLVARYTIEGEVAFRPRSRRPHTNPTKTAIEVEDLIVAIRKRLAEHGWDAGAETIQATLASTGHAVPSIATIWRILSDEDRCSTVRSGSVAPACGSRAAAPSLTSRSPANVNGEWRGRSAFCVQRSQAAGSSNEGATTLRS
jgi:transposase